ncbi:MAG: hypothetical protein OWQ57_05920 [Sulfobacillus sp.]|nr:hypothetical protein [Sulfobacillus sp.]
MRRWPRVLISAATSAVLATAVSVPAWAAGGTIHYTPCPFGKCVSMGNQPANPYAGLPPMWAWVWFSNSGGLTIAYGIDQEGFPFPKVPAKLANAWQKHPIDNPAPLLWYYHHVSKTALGTSAFGPGVKYTAALIQKMKAEHFSPAMIGGPLPPNWNAVPAKHAPPPPPKAKQPKTSKPQPKARPKGIKAPRARTPRGKAPKAHAKTPDA